VELQCRLSLHTTRLIMAKKFKPHMMYSRAGKGIKANTYAKHMELKKKGYKHTKPKNK